MIAGEPDMSRLPEAMEAGIRECVQNFIGEPPKAPMKGKFGLDAFRRWADALVDTKDRNAWPKKFAPGSWMYSGLTSIVKFIDLYYTGGCGARGVYADFLDEAADVLRKPALKGVAQQYRAAARL